MKKIGPVAFLASDPPTEHGVTCPALFFYGLVTGLVSCCLLPKMLARCKGLPKQNR
jgi:hypothetical protein